MSISKEEFFEVIAKPLAEKVVTIGGNDYRLREMSEEAGCDYEIALSSGGKWDIKKARRAMIAVMLVDDQGNRIVDDESQLKSMSRALAGELYDACLKLNSYQEGEVEELIKNSEPAEG